MKLPGQGLVPSGQSKAGFGHFARTPSAIPINIVSVLIALLWFFPIYWMLVTTLKSEHEVVSKTIGLLPTRVTFEAYEYIFQRTKIVTWYANSVIVSTIVTVLTVSMSAACGYAISQLKFPGRNLLWYAILASFMVPIQALIINHFVIISDIGAVNTLLGTILPQLIYPMITIVYKQFFDSVPHDFREAAALEGAGHLRILFKLYLPMNWGTTVALAIITFIGSWNAFLWPFLVASTEDVMTVNVGITQVKDTFGVPYARLLAGGVLTGLPVAIIYLLFQRRVTQAITLSAGIKG